MTFEELTWARILATGIVGAAGGVAALGPTGLPVIGPGPSYNVTPTSLPNWRKGVAGVQAGTRPCKVLVVSDSRGTYNTQTLTAGQTGWAAALVKRLNARGINAQRGMTAPVDGLASDYKAGDVQTDGRVTLGTGWTNNTRSAGADGLFWAGSYGAWVCAIGGTGTFTFTPGVLGGYVDSFDCYYQAGGFNANIDGGANTAVPASNGAIGKFSLTGVAAGTGHALNVLTPAAGAGIAITGVEPFLSTTPAVRVANASIASSKATDWATTAGGAYIPLAAMGCIEAYAPDLTIIDLGVNDLFSGATVAAIIAAIQTLITAAQVSGDVVLVVPYLMNPATTGGYNALLPGLRTALLALNLPTLDIYSRWSSYTLADGQGFLDDGSGEIGAGIHASVPGWQDYSSGIDALLRAAA